MNIQDFEKRLGTETQCLKYLYKTRWGKGHRCPRCNCSKKWNVGDFKYKCQKCGYQTTVTAGTLFHHTHIPIELWFRAIWYITSNAERDVKKLQKELGISRKRTADKIFNKLMWAMVKPNFDKLSGRITIDTYRLNTKFQDCFYIIVAECGIDNRKRFCISDFINFDVIRDFIEKNIKEGSEIVYDEKMTIIEKKELKEYHIISNDYYSAKGKELYFNTDRSFYIDFINNRRLSSENDIIKHLLLYNSLLNASKNKFTFDELLKNAANTSPISTNMTPLEYWQTYNKLPYIRYFNDKMENI